MIALELLAVAGSVAVVWVVTNLLVACWEWVGRR